MENKMHSIVFTGLQELEIQVFDKPVCPQDKLLVKVEATALCTFEQRIFKGATNPGYPFIGGHEIAAVIEEVGERLKDHYQVGEKVVVGNMYACGKCFFCQSYDSQSCLTYDDNKVLDGQPYQGTGGLSEYMLIEPRNAFRYYHVAPTEACLMEPLACVVQSVESVDPQFGDYAVVIGAGMMGQLHTQLCVKKGCCVIVTDMNEERLQLAKQFGAHYTINPEKEDVANRIKEITNGMMAKCVFDTTPIASVVKDSFDYVGNTGTIMIYSGIYPNKDISINPHWMHKKGITLKGTANANQRDFIRAGSMISNGIVDMKPLISGIYSAKDALEACISAAKGDKYRNIIVMDYDE